jgi:hypothetical protein
MNVNSQVPNVVIPAVNNMDEEDNAVFNQVRTIVAQERVPSIGTSLVGLSRPSLVMSKRPPKHRGSILEHAISGTSIIGIQMLDPHTVQVVLQLDSTPMGAAVMVNAF